MISESETKTETKIKRLIHFNLQINIESDPEQPTNDFKMTRIQHAKHDNVTLVLAVI